MKLKIKKASSFNRKAVSDDEYSCEIDFLVYGQFENTTLFSNPTDDPLTSKRKIGDIYHDEKILVRFNIDIEARDWGIKNISINSIQGPKEIEVTLQVDEDETIEIPVTIPVDWSKIYILRSSSTTGSITVDEAIIYLKNDEMGAIVVDYDESHVTTLDKQ